MTTRNRKQGSTLMVVAAFAIVYIVWGSTYFFIQKAIQDFPPLLLGVLRFIIAGLLLLGWSALRKERIFERKAMFVAAITGVLLLFVGNGAVIWVEQFMPSAMVAIMVSSSPLWFVLLDKPKWKENFSSRSTIAGLIIGFAGVMLLFGEKLLQIFSSGGSSVQLGGLALLLIGSIAWAGGSLYSKYKGSGGSATVNTSWQMLAAGLAFLPGSLARGEFAGVNWNAISGSAWFSLFYLIIFGSIAAYSAYVWLLKVRPATQVSTYAYVNPVVAVLLGVFFANEHITAIQVTGLVVILGSVLIINLNKYRKPSNPKPVEPFVRTWTREREAAEAEV